MTKKQTYLIGILFSILLFAIPVFRAELLSFPNRPRINLFFQNYGINFTISISIIFLIFFLSKILNFKFWKVSIFFMGIELLYFLILNFSFNYLPQSVKVSRWFNHFKGVSLKNRPMIQFEETCAKYDSILFYTLKPGVGNFRHHEFNVEYKINSLGLRDNEADLISPEIVTIGDSFTMGWGIEQDSTYSEILQKSSGKKLLNMGISSFGTAREAVALERINTDSTKLIILQFHDTDLSENNFYVKNNKLGDKTQLDFDNQVKSNNILKRYYPFKYLKSAFVQFITPSDATPLSKDKLGSEYKKYPNFLPEFYQIITKIRERYKGKILITYLGSFYTEPQVVEEFEKYARLNSIQGLDFLNLGGKLNETDYFYFDDHINSQGHHKVASLLSEKVKSMAL